MFRAGRRSFTTVTRNSHFDSLPQSSTARQITSVVPSGKKLPDGGLQLIVGVGSLSSVATTVKSTRVPATSFETHTTMFEGQMMTGGVVSRFTVTVNVQRSRLPQSSLTSQITVVVPIGNVLPGGGMQVTCGVGSLP